jgi:two-component system sensor histidine kinase VicK
MKYPRFRSLGLQIVTVACICVSVVLSIAIVSILFMIGSVLREDLGDRTQQTLNYNYQLVRFQVSRARSILEALALEELTVDIFSSEENSEERARLTEKFDDTMALVKFLENIALQETTCKVLVADSSYERETIKNFFASEYCIGLGGESSTFVSSAFTSSVSERSVVLISVPIVDDSEKRLGQLSAVIDVGDLSAYLSQMQENDGFTVVLDRNGRVVIDTRRGTNDQGIAVSHDPLITKVWGYVSGNVYNGFFEDNINTNDVVVGFHQYAADPGAFTLINVEPRVLATQLQRRIAVILSSVGAVMLAALILALWLTTRWSTRRLNQMTEALGSIVKGDEDVHLPEEMFSSEDEVGMLGRSFNHMIDRVREAQKNLENARKKSEAILLGIGDGVLAIDTSGDVIMFNKAAEKISGYSAKTVIGAPYKQYIQFVKGENNSVEDGFIQQALSGSIAVMPEGVSLIRKDGTLVSVADSSAPIKDAEGNVVGAVVVFRDVTHEREVDRLKSEFVSVASHQLRTPLTAIRWNLEDIQSEEMGALNAEQKDSVAQVVISTGRMIRLVNDLLDVSRLESGRLSIRPAPTDIGAMLTDVVEEHGVLAREKKCAVRLHLPEQALAPISVDPMLIRQVIVNIVSNAIKYSCSGEREPVVDVTFSKDGDLYYRVEIRDNGMGIGKKDEERIFQRFFRADNAVKRQTEGSGLGLYIAKLIIEESGGIISFSSTEGEGSKFWFLLPVAGSKERLGGKTLTSHE